MKSIRHFRELDVYQEAMSLVMRITELTKGFPSDERFALTDHIKRLSRSICANLAEAWRKRRYEAAFVSKLNDAETDAAETQVHLEIAFRHDHIESGAFEENDDVCDNIISQIVKMIDRADLWVIKPKPQRRNRR
ncbi:MAG: four helix bundle protein [Verrucomicrobia bacterium]|nr:four helix bundle protein [Verrucomicrobiota bacterium]